MSDVLKRLRDAAEAYPEDVFSGTTDDDRERHPGVVQRSAASMGRHFSPLFTAAADLIEQQAERIAELEAIVGKVVDADSRFGHFAAMKQTGDVREASPFNLLIDAASVIHEAAEAARKETKDG